jgi:tetratricopeptide (TPR) repeat protein
MDAVTAQKTELNISDAIRLAKGLFEDNHYEEALPIFKAAASAGAGFDAINGLALCLNELEKPQEALPIFDQAYSVLRDEMMALMANRAKALSGVGRAAEALNIYDGLLQSNPRILFIRYSRSLVLLQIGKYQEAIEQLSSVISLDPDNDLARFARGFGELVLGDYENGFRDYESRLKDSIDAIDVPLWTGQENLTDKTILVHGEMGLGDNIMFMRYVPMLAERAKKVIVVVPKSQYPLVPKIDGVEFRNSDRATWPKIDYWVRFMSLAYCFRTTAENVPLPAPLNYDPIISAKWRGLISSPKLKVGLCWSGSAKSRYDAWRSIPLKELAPLFDIPGIQFYSFQLGVRDSDLEAYAAQRCPDNQGVPPLADFTYELTDFGETAHAMRELDLMITVDTSVAHLAGTVGVPTFVMLTEFRTYWLWISKLETSPWYPSVRVFRQPSDGDWKTVVGNIRAALSQRFELKAA